MRLLQFTHLWHFIYLLVINSCHRYVLWTVCGRFFSFLTCTMVFTLSSSVYYYINNKIYMLCFRLSLSISHFFCVFEVLLVLQIILCSSQSLGSMVFKHFSKQIITLSLQYLNFECWTCQYLVIRNYWFDLQCVKCLVASWFRGIHEEGMGLRVGAVA